VTLRVPLAPAAGLDAGIAGFVAMLREHGVETFESCDGSAGHSYTEPTVRFFGHGFPVECLRRFWDVIEGEPRGPYWEITLRREATQ
jgi:hypothetical protein